MTIQRVEIQRSRLSGNINELNASLRALDRDFTKHVNTVRTSVERILVQLEDHHQYRMNTLQRQIGHLDTKINELPDLIDKVVVSERKADAKKIKDLEAQIEALKQGNIAKAVTEVEQVGVEKAKTIAIFDSILFAISNWSNDGQTAPDIELVCQSVLFPAVYERVMGGQSDYVIEKVPTAAEEVVKRGRELTQHIRSIEESSLVTPTVWEKHHSMIKEWIVGDALPLLYGARDPKWDEDDVLSLDEILEWRDQPASRALHFPLIFDGMELVERFRDEIRETTGLPDFTKATMSTRLEVL